MKKWLYKTAFFFIAFAIVSGCDSDDKDECEFAGTVCVDGGLVSCVDGKKSVAACPNGCGLNNACYRSEACKSGKRVCVQNELYVCFAGEERAINCPNGCFDGACFETSVCVTRQPFCDGDVLYSCEDGLEHRTTCENGCSSGACNETTVCLSDGPVCVGNELYSCETGVETHVTCETGCNHDACYDSMACVLKTPVCVGDSLYSCENGRESRKKCDLGCSDGACVVSDICVFDEPICLDGNVVSCKDGHQETKVCEYGCYRGACNETEACMTKGKVCKDNSLYSCEYGVETKKSCESCSDGVCVELSVCDSETPICIDGNAVSCENGKSVTKSCEYGCYRGVCNETDVCSRQGKVCKNGNLYSCEYGLEVKALCENGCYDDECYETKACKENKSVCVGKELYTCENGIETHETCYGECDVDHCVLLHPDAGKSCIPGEYEESCSGNRIVFCSSEEYKVVVKDCEDDSECMIDNDTHLSYCTTECDKSVGDKVLSDCYDYYLDLDFAYNYHCKLATDGRYGWFYDNYQFCSVCEEDAYGDGVCKVTDHDKGIGLKVGQSCSYYLYQGYCKDSKTVVGCLPKNNDPFNAFVGEIACSEMEICQEYPGYEGYYGCFSSPCDEPLESRKLCSEMIYGEGQRAVYSYTYVCTMDHEINGLGWNESFNEYCYSNVCDENGACIQPEYLPGAPCDVENEKAYYCIEKYLADYDASVYFGLICTRNSSGDLEWDYTDEADYCPTKCNADFTGCL